VEENYETDKAPEPKALASAQLKFEIPAPEPILEQPTDSTVDTDKSDIQGKSQRWVNVCPTSEKGKPAPSDAMSKPGRGMLSRILKPFGSAKKAEDPNGDERREGDGEARATIPEKVKENSGSDDADWDEVSDEDKKEKLWEDDGEWVNIEAS